MITATSVAWPVSCTKREAAPISDRAFDTFRSGAPAGVSSPVSVSSRPTMNQIPAFVSDRTSLTVSLLPLFAAGAMYFTDAFAATACLVLAIFLFIVIHYSSPPKSWGDFSRNLHYHIVRKYLLRLDERKGHVKYWRPQILLLANNPRTEWNLLIFCNRSVRSRGSGEMTYLA